MAKKLFEYNPTKFKFDSKKWRRKYYEKCKLDKSLERIYSSGLILGELILKNDIGYENIREKESVSFPTLFFRLINQALESLSRAEKSLSTDLGGEVELYATVYELLSKEVVRGETELNFQDEIRVVDKMLENVKQRATLVNIWDDIYLFEWEIKKNKNFIHIAPTNYDYEFGRSISLQRMHSTLKQVLWQEAEKIRNCGGTELLYPFKQIPSGACLVDGKLELEYSKPNEYTALKVLTLAIQADFYLKSFANREIPALRGASIIDVIGFWAFLDVLSKTLTDSISDFRNPSPDLYRRLFSFTYEELEDAFASCVSISTIKIKGLIDAFIKIPKDGCDIWIKPLVEFDKKLWLHAPFAMSSSFTRIVDHVVTLDKSSEHIIDKGKLFEKEVYAELRKQINSNEIIKNGTEVICYSYKPPGSENEELDVVIKLGESFLIIEAKSFKYSTEVRKYTNNLNRISDSNLQQKIDVFIREIEDFKIKHNLDFEFEVTKDNVVGCYLSSIPHALGTFVNGFPIVDMSILERYFGDGNFLFSTNGAQRTEEFEVFRFYNNLIEAQRNLKTYLLSPPQLEKYKSCFKVKEYFLPLKGVDEYEVSLTRGEMIITEEKEREYTKQCGNNHQSWALEPRKIM